MAVHAFGQRVQLLAHVARHIAAVLCPQLLVTFEQLGCVKRQAAFAQRQRPQQVGGLPDGGAHAVQVGRLLRGHAHPVRELVEQVMDVLALFRRDRHDRHAQPPLEFGHIDLDALRAHIVHKAERHDHGQAKRNELQRQIQVALDVGRIHDVENAVQLVGQHILARDDLLLRIGRERIDARQVDDVHAHAIVADVAGLAVDRYARPVADMLVGAGQAVEQRGLAAVRVADNGDRLFPVHAPASSTIFFASARRSDRL